MLCQGIVILDGQGDLQTSWTIRWPAVGTRGPASFDGVIDGGTGRFAAAHGTFHAATLPDGDMQVTAKIDASQCFTACTATLDDRYQRKGALTWPAL